MLRQSKLIILCALSFGTTVASASPVPISTPPILLAAAQSCEQVISCGTKDGKRKEYPTPCAARDDGATDIKPKTGSTCETTQ